MKKNPIDSYKQEVNNKLRKKPSEIIRKSLNHWDSTIDRLLREEDLGPTERPHYLTFAIYEAVAIIFSKWEFLGGLYYGKQNGTGGKDFKRFVEKFSEFKEVNKHIDLKEVYNMFRNNTFHSDEPAPYFVKNENRLIRGIVLVKQPGFGIKEHEGSKQEEIFLYNKDYLTIYCSGLKKDFKSSVERYIKYLEENRGEDREDLTAEQKNKTPEVRFRQGYWYCFMPKGMNRGEWNSACKFQ